MGYTVVYETTPSVILGNPSIHLLSYLQEYHLPRLPSDVSSTLASLAESRPAALTAFRQGLAQWTVWADNAVDQLRQLVETGLITPASFAALFEALLHPAYRHREETYFQWRDLVHAGNAHPSDPSISPSDATLDLLRYHAQRDWARHFYQLRGPPGAVSRAGQSPAAVSA